MMTLVTKTPTGSCGEYKEDHQTQTAEFFLINLRSVHSFKGTRDRVM